MDQLDRENNEDHVPDSFFTQNILNNIDEHDC